MKSDAQQIADAVLWGIDQNDLELGLSRVSLQIRDYRMEEASAEANYEKVMLDEIKDMLPVLSTDGLEELHELIRSYLYDRDPQLHRSIPF